MDSPFALIVLSGAHRRHEGKLINRAEISFVTAVSRSDPSKFVKGGLSRHTPRADWD